MLSGFANLLVLTMAVSAAPDTAPRPDSPELVRARERAVAFLVKELESPIAEYGGQEGGVPSLVALALLKSGVKATAILAGRRFGFRRRMPVLAGGFIEPMLPWRYWPTPGAKHYAYLQITSRNIRDWHALCSESEPRNKTRLSTEI